MIKVKSLEFVIHFFVKGIPHSYDKIYHLTLEKILKLTGYFGNNY
jgi:hypothetical protein